MSEKQGDLPSPSIYVTVEYSGIIFETIMLSWCLLYPVCYGLTLLYIYNYCDFKLWVIRSAKAVHCADHKRELVPSLAFILSP